MATYDWTGTDVIPNGSGSAVRADLNDAFLALFSQNSSATAPPETVAYMPWADTANGLYKIRNGANSGWITLYQLDGEWTSIALENGTAAAPSLYFKDSGTDTGLYSPGTDQVAIATAGVQRVNFNGSTEVVFNDTGADVDFRIEGDTKPNLFKVDAGTDAVSIDGTLSITGVSSGMLNRGTLVSPVSPVFTPTEIDFTIPSWVKRITLAFQGISLSATAHYLVRLGDSGGIENTGYNSNTNILLGGSSSNTLSNTTGMILWGGGTANAISGSLTFINVGNNFWIGTASYMFDNFTGYTNDAVCRKTLSDTCTQLRLTTTGSDTFVAGAVNIFYEG